MSHRGNAKAVELTFGVGRAAVGVSVAKGGCIILRGGAHRLEFSSPHEAVGAIVKTLDDPLRITVGPSYIYGIDVTDADVRRIMRTLLAAEGDDAACVATTAASAVVLAWIHSGMAAPRSRQLAIAASLELVVDAVPSLEQVAFAGEVLRSAGELMTNDAAASSRVQELVQLTVASAVRAVSTKVGTMTTLVAYAGDAAGIPPDDLLGRSLQIVLHTISASLRDVAHRLTSVVDALPTSIVHDAHGMPLVKFSNGQCLTVVDFNALLTTCRHLGLQQRDGLLTRVLPLRLVPLRLRGRLLMGRGRLPVVDEHDSGALHAERRRRRHKSRHQLVQHRRAIRLGPERMDQAENIDQNNLSARLAGVHRFRHGLGYERFKIFMEPHLF